MAPRWQAGAAGLLCLCLFLQLSEAKILGLKDVYIPTLFSSTGKSMPLIRASAVCMGAPRPWQGFYNTTPEATLPEDIEWMKGPEERQGKLQEKRTPLRDNYCEGKQPTEPKKALSAAETALAECLKADISGCKADANVLRNAALALPGVKMLMGKPPKCFRVLKSGACASTDGNVETDIMGTFDPKTAPSADWRRGQTEMWPRQWPTCALVGRSPLIHVAKNGRAIDSHSAVWRFNLAPTEGLTDYVGKRTTIRMVNNADSEKAMKGKRGAGESAAVTVADEHESWLFWQYNAVGNMRGVADKLKVPVALVSPQFIRWQMDAYFEIKRNLEELGLGPFLCPTAVSSGIHGVLMATALCSQVDLFGYSYSYSQLLTRPGHNSGPQEMYPGHSWRFDAMFLRLLHYAGIASVCTADDPALSDSELRQRVARTGGGGASSGSGGGGGGGAAATATATPEREADGEAKGRGDAGAGAGGAGAGAGAGVGAGEGAAQQAQGDVTVGPQQAAVASRRSGPGGTARSRSSGRGRAAGAGGAAAARASGGDGGESKGEDAQQQRATTSARTGSGGGGSASRGGGESGSGGSASGGGGGTSRSRGSSASAAAAGGKKPTTTAAAGGGGGSSSGGGGSSKSSRSSRKSKPQRDET